MNQILDGSTKRSTAVSGITRFHPKSAPLTLAQIEAFGAELDALRARTQASLGAADARYIRRVYAAARYSGFAARILLFVGAFVPTLLIPAWILGVLLLALSKILENMEVAHNVIHGQYDWMRDPRFDGRSYEWDMPGTAENWRYSHNFKHHTYTNIRGLDEDLGYGIMRLFPEQRWKPFHLAQPLIAIVFALWFQWGIAAQTLKFGRWFQGRSSWKTLRAQMAPVQRKAAWQLFKDYLLFPALAGPGFLVVFSGNLAANAIRNVWTWVVIFCGHFTAEVQTYPRSCLDGETRGHWYLRQLHGSSNLAGSRWLDLMTGNLSHQIEHHLFPDLPANRYRSMAVEVRAICARYDQHYNTGSLPRQFGQVLWRILRYALPSRRPVLVPTQAVNG
jgi:linoleoyl-CoA desaturase